MKWPKRYPSWDLIDGELVYKLKDIEPLLDELVRLKAEEIRNNTYPNKIGREAYRFSADGTFYCNPVESEKKPFPSLEEFKEWFKRFDLPYNLMELIHSYFSQFQYEKTVFPKVGEEYEFSGTGGSYFKRSLKGFITGTSVTYPYIRPITRPTQEEVIAQVESKLKSNELTFDRELVEQFLNILKGQDNETT